MSRYNDGKVRGAEWSKHPDNADEIAKLKAFRNEKSDDEEWREWFIGHDAGRSAYKRIVSILQPQTAGAPDDVSGFWQHAVAFDANFPDAALFGGDFVRGFCDGALEQKKKG